MQVRLGRYPPFYINAKNNGILDDHAAESSIAPISTFPMCSKVVCNTSGWSKVRGEKMTSSPLEPANAQHRIWTLRQRDRKIRTHLIEDSR